MAGGEELRLVRGAAPRRRAQRRGAGGVDRPLDLRRAAPPRARSACRPRSPRTCARRPRAAPRSCRPRGTPGRRPSSRAAPTGGRARRTAPAPRRGRSSRLPSPRTATRRSSPRSSERAGQLGADEAGRAGEKRLAHRAASTGAASYRLPPDAARRRRHGHHRLPAGGRRGAARDRLRPALRGLRVRPHGEGDRDHRLPGVLRGAARAPTRCPPPPSRRWATSSPASRSCSAEGSDVVSIHISAGISGTYDSARQAAEQLEREGKGGERVRVVDSTTTGGRPGAARAGGGRRGARRAARSTRSRSARARRARS